MSAGADGPRVPGSLVYCCGETNPLLLLLLLLLLSPPPPLFVVIVVVVVVASASVVVIVIVVICTARTQESCNGFKVLSICSDRLMQFYIQLLVLCLRAQFSHR